MFRKAPDSGYSYPKRDFRHQAALSLNFSELKPGSFCQSEKYSSLKYFFFNEFWHTTIFEKKKILAEEYRGLLGAIFEGDRTQKVQL